MVKNIQKNDLEDQLNRFEKKNSGLIVHGLRILCKLGIALVVLLSRNQNFLIIALFLLVSEIIDQLSVLAVNVRPKIKRWIRVVYALNSVTVISLVIFLTGWVRNDFYLFYLIHISSATFAYGFNAGLFSSLLSTFVYCLMLFLGHSPIIFYLRLPLLAIVVLRLLVNEKQYERINEFLAYVLNIEKAKKDFIAIASHNLRTPVAAIYGYIELLFRGDAGKLKKEQEEIVEKIKQNNRELEELSERLLQISIIEIGEEVDLFKQPSQVDVVIKDIIENLAPVAGAKGLSLFYRPEGLLPLVNIDVQKMEAVITNLIDNSIKYTEKGEIVIEAKKDGKFLVITVKDSGIGIPKEEMPNLFNKFFRSGSILVYNKKGTGLGLYLGKKIVELHGGKIQASSIEGQGSTFTIFLPVIKGDYFE